MPRLTAVMLAWRDEPLLVESVHAVLASEDVDVDVVLVDNGCTSDAVQRLATSAGVTVVDPGDNLGFAGGCNLGARHATGEFLAFVNGDAVVRPDALAHLVSALRDDVGLATASVRLYDEPDVINSAGNPVHFTGLSWAGGLGQPATSYAVEREVASASGAAMACRRERFASLGGFCEPMFAYCEDAELSLRSWQRGWKVVYVPEAVALHRYEFSRNPQKFYLLERNRLLLVLTLFGPGLLLGALLPLLALELATLGLALRDGWARQKVAGWWWLLRHAGLVRSRRRQVRSERLVSDHELARVLTGDLDVDVPGLTVPALARRASRGYWSIARRLA
ncbi:MAG: glycosyltransferase family 2 protein [Actinomycetota bacterium]|nr:glycosyltransferase family 2 protein [Actinomycetota bacterium]